MSTQRNKSHRVAKILVPTDLSFLAGCFEADMDVLHVWNLPSNPTERWPTPAFAKRRGWARATLSMGLPLRTSEARPVSDLPSARGRKYERERTCVVTFGFIALAP